MTGDDDLLARISARAESGRRKLSPVVPTRIREAEGALGFALPPLLARIYLEIGDGGFGPEPLFPLTGGEGRSIVGIYQSMRASGDWPEGVLPVLDWGCAMMAAVDCTDVQAPVLLFEPNAIVEAESDAWFVDSASLRDWLETWLSGAGWYAEGSVLGESFGLRRWPGASRGGR